MIPLHDHSHRLLVIVGASGAGKDSVLKGWLSSLPHELAPHRARRTITRDADDASENHEAIADYQRRLVDVYNDRGAERLARSLVAIEEGDVKRDVRWTAEHIKQLRRRIGGPQLGLLIDAMQQANTAPPKEPDPLG